MEATRESILAALGDPLACASSVAPDALPPAEDVKKVERRLASEDKKATNKPDRLDN